MFDFVKKLFRKTEEKPVVQLAPDVKTAPLSDEQLFPGLESPKKIYPSQLLVGSGQSVGKQRDHNEDTLFTLNALLADGDSNIPFGLFIVADGMGGHLNGEVASGAATRAMSEYLVSRLINSLYGLNPQSQSESLQEIMESAVREAHQAVVRRAPGGGTTLTAALVVGEQVTFAHVGDSRAYFIFPDGRVQAITLDHSLVRRLIDLGQLTEEQARNYPQKNVLYRALGQAEPYRPDIHTHLVPHPGYILLCSDGLWGTITDEEIFKIVSNAPTPALACHELVEAANAAGGPDNISAVLIQPLG